MAVGTVDTWIKTLKGSVVVELAALIGDKSSLRFIESIRSCAFNIM